MTFQKSVVGDADAETTITSAISITNTGNAVTDSVAPLKPAQTPKQKAAKRSAVAYTHQEPNPKVAKHYFERSVAADDDATATKSKKKAKKSFERGIIVFVGNLPGGTKAIMRKNIGLLLNPHVKVQSVQIRRSKNSANDAYVTVSTEPEAQTAVGLLTGFHFDGNALHANLFGQEKIPRLKKTKKRSAVANSDPAQEPRQKKVSMMSLRRKKAAAKLSEDIEHARAQMPERKVDVSAMVSVTVDANEKEDAQIDDVEASTDATEDAHEKEDAQNNDVEASTDATSVDKKAGKNAHHIESPAGREEGTKWYDSCTNVYVSNLPNGSDSMRKILKKLLKSRAKVKSVRIRTDNRGSIAFITVPTVTEGQAAADALNGLEFRGSVLYANVMRSTKPSALDEKRSIHVDKLPHVTTDELLHDTFECCGKIEYVRTVRKFDRCSGVGFVMFVDAASVPLALELDNGLLLGRPVKVSRFELSMLRPSRKQQLDSWSAAAKSEEAMAALAATSAW